MPFAEKANGTPLGLSFIGVSHSKLKESFLALGKLGHRGNLGALGNLSNLGNLNSFPN